MPTKKPTPTITERRIKAYVLRLYIEYESKYGKPKMPLKHVYVGKLPEPDDLGLTTQLLGKSHISITDEFVGTKHVDLLSEVVRHELAHVWCGVEYGHNKKWRRWAEKFGCKEVFY